MYIYIYVYIERDVYGVGALKDPASQGPRTGRTGTARPRAWPGPGLAGGRLVFCIYLGYIFGIFFGRTGVQF